MIGQLFSAQADRASARYRALLAGLEGVYRTTLASNPGSARTKALATRLCYQVAESYLAEESRFIADQIQAAGSQGQVSVLQMLVVSPDDPSAAVSHHLDELGSGLDQALRLQLERDVGSVLAGLRDVALRGALIARGRGIPPSDALKIARTDASVSFTFLDRAGRRWASPRYVRTVWRQALVLAWNETSLMTMAEYGVTIAEVNHPDAAHAWSGERISLDEHGILPTWGDVRDEVFHPNSDAWVAPIVEARSKS